MKPIPLPYLSDRIIGVTIPKDGKFFVCDHDQVLEIIISDPPQVQSIDGDPYAFTDRTDFIGLVFDGQTPNEPIHRVGANRIDFTFNPTAEVVNVQYDCSGQRGSIEFRTFSGDWFCASFSEDGRYLILAEPYEVGLFAVLE